MFYGNLAVDFPIYPFFFWSSLLFNFTGWSTETINKLIHQVMALTTPGETVPFNLRGIDWKMVSWGSHTAAKCEEKWKELLTKVIV